MTTPPKDLYPFTSYTLRKDQFTRVFPFAFFIVAVKSVCISARSQRVKSEKFYRSNI